MTDYTPIILNLIKEELVEIISNDDVYSQYDFVLSNEQQYVPEKDRSPRKIYIVVKFLEGTPFAGQNIIPININAIGEQNSVEICQRLLAEFVQQFNLKTTNDTTVETTIIRQFYTTPQVVNNFNEVYAGFRTLFYVGGTMLIGEGSNLIDEVEYIFTKDETEKTEKVDFLSAQWSFDNQLDPQAYTGTKNRTKSIAKIGTLSISFVLYLKNNVFCNTILGIAFGSDSYAPKGNATNFKFNIKFKSGYTVEAMNFKMVNNTGQQNIGEFPTISVSFTN